SSKYLDLRTPTRMITVPINNRLRTKLQFIFVKTTIGAQYNSRSKASSDGLWVPDWHPAAAAEPKTVIQWRGAISTEKWRTLNWSRIRSSIRIVYVTQRQSLNSNNNRAF